MNYLISFRTIFLYLFLIFDCQKLKLFLWTIKSCQENSKGCTIPISVSLTKKRLTWGIDLSRVWTPRKVVWSAAIHVLLCNTLHSNKCPKTVKILARVNWVNSQYAQYVIATFIRRRRRYRGWNNVVCVLG